MPIKADGNIWLQGILCYQVFNLFPMKVLIVKIVIKVIITEENTGNEPEYRPHHCVLHHIPVPIDGTYEDAGLQVFEASSVIY